MVLCYQLYRLAQLILNKIHAGQTNHRRAEKKILHLRDLHYSERAIVSKLGKPKSSIHDVIVNSNPQSAQHPVQPKLQISNDKQQEKAKVPSPAKLEIESPGPPSSPEFYQEQGVVEATIRKEGDRADEFDPFFSDRLTHPRTVDINTRPRQTWGEIAEQKMFRILQKYGLPYREIRDYVKLFRSDLFVLLNDRALLTSLIVAFGEAPGAQAAFFEFKALRPKLVHMYFSQA